jgi:hypothetical protein
MPRMAAETPEITDSNNRVLLEHILTDLHDVVEKLTAMGVIQARHDALLAEFRPLLDQWRSPAATYMARRAQRKNGNGNG